MAETKNYKDLRIWKKGMELTELIYELTALFPEDEKYGLSSQMKRSVVSIPSNIAEGFARQYNKEYRQFLYIAFGSCAELETQLNIAKKLNFNHGRISDKIFKELTYLSKMIMALIKKL